MNKSELEKLIDKWEIEKGSYIPNAPIYQAFINEAKEALERESKVNNVVLDNFSQQCELLVDFWMNLPHTNKNKNVAKHFVDKDLEAKKRFFEIEKRASKSISELKVNNVVSDDVIKCNCELERCERAKMELDYNKCMDCKKEIE